MEMRLQRALAQFGIASRRSAEGLIESGRVTVNGTLAHLGMKIDPLRDHIKVDGKLLIRPESKVYYVFYKPVGVVSTLSDPEGRACIKDYIKNIPQRVFPVGRLDYNSEGLIILTNDGELANAIQHPSQRVYKKYQVKVSGEPSMNAINRLRNGIRLDDGLTQPAKVNFIKKAVKNTWLEISIYEGKQRQIRRMIEAIGHEVLRLIRVSIDGLSLGRLKNGEIRKMTQSEIQTLIQKMQLTKENIISNSKD